MSCWSLTTSLIAIVDTFLFNVIPGMFGMSYTILFRLLPLGGLPSGFLSLSPGLFGHLVELYFLIHLPYLESISAQGFYCCDQATWGEKGLF